MRNIRTWYSHKYNTLSQYIHSCKAVELLQRVLYYYSAPVGVRSIVINPSVCVSVCLPASIYLERHWAIFTNFFVQMPCGRGSVLLWRRCAMLCTSGFIDDVTFGRNGPYGDSGVAIPGRSLMSMNASWNLQETVTAESVFNRYATQSAFNSHWYEPSRYII